MARLAHTLESGPYLKTVARESREWTRIQTITISSALPENSV